MMSISLLEIKSMSSFDFLLIMIPTSLEGVKAWAIEHLLLDLAAVRAPGHQKDLRLERGLGPIRVELVIVIVDTISAVIRVSILLMQVVQKVLVAVVAVAHLWRDAVFKTSPEKLESRQKLTVSTSIIPPWMTKVAYLCFLLFWISWWERKKSLYCCTFDTIQEITLDYLTGLMPSLFKF